MEGGGGGGGGGFPFYKSSGQLKGPLVAEEPQGKKFHYIAKISPSTNIYPTKIKTKNNIIKLK